MHDSKTVAHEIRYPWFDYKPWPKRSRRDPEPYRMKRAWEEMPESLKARRSQTWPNGYRSPFVTIWHVDPECDGTDDSCGYSFVKLTPAQREKLRRAAWAEGYRPHFLRYSSKVYPGTAEEAECFYRGLVLLVVRVLGLKVSMDYVSRYAAEAVHIRDGSSEFGGAFCFLPGYHTNSPKDSESDREHHFHGILCGVARNILTDRRPWFRHPKWHFWHWEFQVHPVGQFKRWAFSRCCKCGGRFKWGESPTTNSWNGTGPRWFRGEPNIYHGRCSEVQPCSQGIPQGA